MSARGSIGSMMAATLVSRALGFLKAILLVAAIGGTSAAVGGQTFEIANSAPTYLFALIAGGVLGAVLVPQIVRNLHDGPVGQENTDRLLTIVLVGGALATVILTLLAPGIVWIYATTWSAQWRGLATSMAYWCLPQIFFLIAFAVLSQVLNARGVFGAPAWAPAISNLLGIGGILVFLFVLPSGLGTVGSWSPMMVAVLSGSATLAIAIQALLLLIPLRRIGFQLRFRWGVGGLGHMSTLAGWTLLGVIAGQAAYLVTANVANSAGKTLNQLGIDGPSLNSLSIAYLLMLLPHGIVTVSLTTALYTRMSGSAARNDLAEIQALSNLAMKPVAYVAIAATAAFVALGPLITEVLFGKPIIGHVLQVLAIGLVGFSQAYVLNRTSFALQDARGPFATQLVIAGLSAAGAAAALLLPPELTVIRIAAGISIANFAGWLTAHLSLQRTLRNRGHVPVGRPRAILGYARLLGAAIISSVAGMSLLASIGTPPGFIGQAILLAAAGVGVVALFIAVSWLLGDRTIGDLRRR
ncbi:putative peptidoglycan lipid II flippase [Cryobacterium sp. MP_M5]|uniref:murein biosynthesis integral membrane protein MurJ n=1 Tax=unclassified Cryobacterium TaxID=2649013 RepID=UPI0018CB2769|nr:MULTISPECIES: lipid II flippase MurJ [unclassified Cryobacterium]MBG6059984.1 putative peptidoglycan lipid II flippase [Cryobacterium sp. MP_M3]MEC5178402.1 putative peptidoglycan lipid II flippase [Cryobacterium sp. MP_M5]